MSGERWSHLPDGSVGGIAYLDAEALEHVADLIGYCEIASPPRVLAFAKQLVKRPASAAPP